jgi:hypothetical protein
MSFAVQPSSWPTFDRAVSLCGPDGGRAPISLVRRWHLMDEAEGGDEQEATYELTSCGIKIKDVGGIGSNGQSSFFEKFVDCPGQSGRI